MKDKLIMTEDDLKIFEKSIEHVEIGPLAHLYFWSIFRPKKRNRVVRNILRGMSFYSAYSNEK